MTTLDELKKQIDTVNAELEAALAAADVIRQKRNALARELAGRLGFAITEVPANQSPNQHAADGDCG